MSVEIFVNTLSANGQFQTRRDAQDALAALISCFQLLRPAISVGTIGICYDSNIERRALLKGSASISACLASIDRDLRQRWYFYTRRCRYAEVHYLEHTLVGEGETIRGLASAEIIDSKILAGFGGSPACTADMVELRDEASGRQAACRSVHEATGLKRLLPRYEPNPKHRAAPYWSHGELISPMSVNEDDAQSALFAAISDGSGHYYGAHGSKLLKFVLTGDSGGPVYHGYEVKIGEVPEGILSQLRSR